MVLGATPTALRLIRGLQRAERRQSIRQSARGRQRPSLVTFFFFCDSARSVLDSNNRLATTGVQRCGVGGFAAKLAGSYAQ